MFDIGFWELVIIFVIGLVVLGPERMPAAVRSVAQFIRKVKQFAAGVQQDIDQELHIKQLQEDLKKAEQKNLADLDPELNQSLNELREQARSVQRPYADTESSEQAPTKPALTSPSQQEKQSDTDRSS